MMRAWVCLVPFAIGACHLVPRESRSSSANVRLDSASRVSFPPVIMYHEIREDKAYNHFDVMKQDFEAQLDWLLANGYRTLSMDEFLSAVGTPEARKAVLLTFDDAYAGNFSVAAPLLRARGMKAVFFSHVGKVGSRSIANYSIMTWNELQILDADPLFEVYSHTVTHPDLTSISAENLQEELVRSRETVEQKFGGARNFIAFPMGKYDAHVLEAVSAAGYVLAFSVADKGLFGHAARLSIPRIYVGTVMADLGFFSRCVRNYHEFPSECFVERWAPIQ